MRDAVQSSQTLQTVLLLALPASGKSELRRFLAQLPPTKRARDFHLGPMLQIDDFVYVHAMRRIDEELARRGEPGLFFLAPQRPLRDGRDWGTLIALVNEDHADLVAGRTEQPASAATHLFARLDAASVAAGMPPRLAGLQDRTRRALAEALEAEARALRAGQRAARPDTLEGTTVVIELARGGPDGAALPLAAPRGYRYSLPRLSRAILERAAILHVQVTPEESRRRNEARADPDDPGSILHHGVPLEVMLNDYGTDDIGWLEEHARRPGSVTVEAHGTWFDLPIARFDNRVDKTSFLRGPREAWRATEVCAVHDGLRAALDLLARRERELRGSGQITL